ncbi:MAG: carboxypeptidase regulatory-like domain-containing protein [Euryarchaeota archaeon]|nr:carboxypeptidase regulatory-like domain-containing protein [Euryarchaeota archaeon]
MVPGMVVDDQGLPLAGAAVAVAHESNLTVIANVTSDAQGRFKVGPAPRGDWLLVINAPGFETFARKIKIGDEGFRGELRAPLRPIPVPVPYKETFPTTIHVEYGAAWAAGGDFNQGCLQPSYTCNAFAYPSANIQLYAADPKLTPLATIVLEETWQANSPVCAKAAALDLYNPDAPSTNFPSFDNPHYWTNYPSTRAKTSNPITMVIPRDEEGNTDAMNDPKRLEKNGGDKLIVKGNWTLRHFPPGKGITNLPVDANCFTDQKFFIYWSTFYYDVAAPAFSALPPT